MWSHYTVHTSLNTNGIFSGQTDVFGCDNTTKVKDLVVFLSSQFNTFTMGVC
jgi:hypothetical protein